MVLESRIQGIGWVSANYLEKVALVDTPSKTYQVTALSLNVRKGAGGNNSLVRSLKRGTSGVKVLKLKQVKGTYWTKVAKLNKILSPYTLTVGQKLALY